MPLPSHPNSAYTIGWICALPVEMAAAKGMLDEIHDNPHTAPKQCDANSYLLGRIQDHHIVIACLPRDEMGSASAAIVASHMQCSFPRIEIGLSVGIGSGIPHYSSSHSETKDIRLGDVVVANDAKTSGLVAFTSGKRHGDGSFEVINALSRPPRALRAALSRFEAELMTASGGIGESVTRMLHRYPAMRRRGFVYPNGADDVLFEAGYRHAGGSTCKGCDRVGKEVKGRPTRWDNEPEVHFGVIASGCEIISHTPTRERVREEHDAICVDNWAAGLMNHFPCLVIRGISDYADSHKNDQWKAYAAATAAACAKELLGYVFVKANPTRISEEATKPEPIPGTNTAETFSSTDATVVAGQEDDSHSTILSWIAELDLLAQQNYLLERWKSSITMSMLQHHMFQRWTARPRHERRFSYSRLGGYAMAGRFLDHHRYSSRKDLESRKPLEPLLASFKQSILSGLWSGGLSNGFDYDGVKAV